MVLILYRLMNKAEATWAGTFLMSRDEGGD